jgi:putative membrane protein
MNESDKLAIVRTSLAHDRTLLAWVRTAIGIIGFGFSFYKFFEYMAEQERYVPQHRLLGPRQYAIILIVTGIAALLFATVDYYRAKKQIKLLVPDVPRSPAPFIAIFVVAFGLVTMLAAVFRF